MGSGEPILTQTRVDRFLSSPQRVDVGMIGGEAGSHLGTLGDGALEVIRGRVAKQIFLIGSLGTSKTYGTAHAMVSVAHSLPGSR